MICGVEAMTINWEVWDVFDEFSVFDAAYLWAEVEPPPRTFRQILPAHIKALMDAIEKDAGGYRGDAIYSVSMSGDSGNRYPEKVARTALKKMAETMGVKPKFLFKEMRTDIAETTTPSLEDKPLHTKERNSYLKFIRGLLRELKIDPSERAIAKRLMSRTGLGYDKVQDILEELRNLGD
jgi:hypothetical protein